MKINVVQLDIARTRETWPRETLFAPAYVYRRKHNEQSRWFVLDAPLGNDLPPSWANAEHDEYVRIPLFPYMLSAKADLALAYMLQLGLSCAGHLPRAVEQFYVVTGSPVELLYDPDTDENTGIRYWVGFGVVLSI
jgi:hypothetical protein